MNPANHPPSISPSRPAAFGAASARRRRGFSLIEVNMAILVVAGGLLSLVALFPAGLRMSVSAIGDTRQALFASDVLNSLRANAAELDRSVWLGTPTAFWKEIAKNTPVAGYDASSLAEKVEPHAQVLLVTGEDDEYFTGTANSASLGKVPVRYRIRLDRRRAFANAARNNKLDHLNQNLDYLTWRITMNAVDQRDVSFENNSLYHMEIRYTGRP